MSKLDVLMMPGEQPPRRSTIKRHLLFFDGIVLPDPDDHALIHRGEVSETFRNGMQIDWFERVPFPRTPDYFESLTELRRETARLQQLRKLRFLTRDFDRAKLDAGPNWTAYSAAIADDSVVRSAVPDATALPPPFKLPSGVYSGASMAPTGERSRYHVDVATPAEVSGAHDQWSAVAWARIGRVLKYTRRATIEGAFPMALDEPTGNILLTLGGRAFRDPVTPTDVADLAIAADVVDQSVHPRRRPPLRTRRLDIGLRATRRALIPSSFSTLCRGTFEVEHSRVLNQREVPNLRMVWVRLRIV